MNTPRRSKPRARTRLANTVRNLHAIEAGDLYEALAAMNFVIGYAHWQHQQRPGELTAEEEFTASARLEKIQGAYERLKAIYDGEDE